MEERKYPAFQPMRSLIYASEIKAVGEAIYEVDDKNIGLEREYELSFGKNDELATRKRELKVQMRELIAKKQALIAERDDLRARQTELIGFIKMIESLPDKPARFSPATFTATIDCIKVSDSNISYHFYGNEAIKISIDELKKLCR